MKAKIDTETGRTLYGLRLAVGEPPFANIRSNLRLDRFSLKGKNKVNAQWNLFCILHKDGFRRGQAAVSYCFTDITS
jgi:hypothetical protein